MCMVCPSCCSDEPSQVPTATVYPPGIDYCELEDNAGCGEVMESTTTAAAQNLQIRSPMRSDDYIEELAFRTATAKSGAARKRATVDYFDHNEIVRKADKKYNEEWV